MLCISVILGTMLNVFVIVVIDIIKYIAPIRMIIDIT